MARPSRRTFLQYTATAGLTAPALMPALARAQSANGTVRHVSFGANGMAWSDTKSLQRHKKLKHVAFCDVDKNRFDRADKEFPNTGRYQDYRVLLDKEHKNFDSCNVTVPDHMHAAIGLAAMQLGKHVYGQKPLAQNLFETRQLTLAAKKHGVVTQMGTQIHSAIQYRMAVKLVQDGAIGKIKEVHSFSNKKWGDGAPRPDRKDPVPANLDWDLWLGVATDRPYIGGGYYHPSNWRKRLDFGTGTFGDMGCHIYDPVFNALALTAPTSVTSSGPKPNAHNWAINAHIKYVFPGTPFTLNPVTVTWYDGDARPPADVAGKVEAELSKLYESRGQKGKNPKLPGQGSIFIGEKGLMLLPHVGTPMLLPAEQYANYDYPKLPGRDHWGSFVDAILGTDKTTCHFGYAGPLTEAVLLGGVATRFPNAELKWDGPNLRFTNHDGANALVKRDYRKGREVEAIA